MAKKVVTPKLIDITLADSIGLWDYNESRPMVNPGREDAASWGVPEQDLPASLADGYDIQKGVVGVMSVDKFVEICGDKLPPGATDDIQAFFREQRGQLIKELTTTQPEYTYHFGGGESDDKSEATGANEDVVSHKVNWQTVVALLTATLSAPVKWVVCAGQRRRRAMPWATALHSVLHPDAGPLHYLASCIDNKVSDWDSFDAVLAAENNRGTSQDYSLASLLRKASDLYRRTLCGETAMGNALIGPIDYTDVKTGKRKNRRGDYQRLHRYAKFALAFPQLQTDSRLLLPPKTDKDGKTVYEAGGYLPPAVFEKEALQCLLGEKQPGKSYYVGVRNAHEEVAGVKLTDDDPRLFAKASHDVCEAYFRLAMGGKSRRDVVVSHNDIRQIVKYPHLAEWSLPISTVLQALLDGDKEIFTPLYLECNGVKVAKSDADKSDADKSDADKSDADKSDADKS